MSPGTPPDLGRDLSEVAIPVLPGCATVTEAMALAARGFTALKFFPAEASGGVAFLQDGLFCRRFRDLRYNRLVWLASRRGRFFDGDNLGFRCLARRFAICGSRFRRRLACGRTFFGGSLFLSAGFFG